MAIFLINLFNGMCLNKVVSAPCYATVCVPGIAEHLKIPNLSGMCICVFCICAPLYSRRPTPFALNRVKNSRVFEMKLLRKGELHNTSVDS